MNKSEFVDWVRTGYGEVIADRFADTVESQEQNGSKAPRFWFAILRQIICADLHPEIMAYRLMLNKQCEANISPMLQDFKITRNLAEEFEEL